MTQLAGCKWHETRAVDTIDGRRLEKLQSDRIRSDQIRSDRSNRIESKRIKTKLDSTRTRSRRQQTSRVESKFGAKSAQFPVSGAESQPAARSSQSRVQLRASGKVSMTRISHLIQAARVSGTCEPVDAPACVIFGRFGRLGNSAGRERRSDACNGSSLVRAKLEPGWWPPRRAAINLVRLSTRLESLRTSWKLN